MIFFYQNDKVGELMLFSEFHILTPKQQDASFVSMSTAAVMLTKEASRCFEKADELVSNPKKRHLIAKMPFVIYLSSNPKNIKK